MAVLVIGVGFISLTLVAYGVYILLRANSEIDNALTTRKAKKYNKALLTRNETLNEENERMRAILDEICSYRNASNPKYALYEVVTMADKELNK